MTSNFNKLSAYTIAENCSDLIDVNDGIKEIKDYFNACEKENKTPCKSSYIRLYKLNNKKEKYV